MLRRLHELWAHCNALQSSRTAADLLDVCPWLALAVESVLTAHSELWAHCKCVAAFPLCGEFRRAMASCGRAAMDRRAHAELLTHSMCADGLPGLWKCAKGSPGVESVLMGHAGLQARCMFADGGPLTYRDAQAPPRAVGALQRAAELPHSC